MYKNQIEMNVIESLIGGKIEWNKSICAQQL